MAWRKAIDQLVDDRFDQLVDLRRHLHAHPELSREELETSLLLYQRLSDAGLSVKMGPEGRGLLVDSVASESNSPRIGLRADIDALRIQDEKTTDYRSQRPGVMHACGHDAHTTCLIGAILTLHEAQQQGILPASLCWRAIFQPAEEVAEGAAQMVQAGAMEDVSAMLALHVDPTLQVGRIGLRSGVLTAFADMIRIDVHGRGSHAARPHESHDPIAAASQLVGALYQLIPRSTDSQETVVVSFGQITGGEAANVIPEQVTLRGTVRTLDRDVRDRTLKQMQQIANGIAQATNTQIDIHTDVSIPSVDNDPLLAGLVAEEGKSLLGIDSVEHLMRPSMGSEDFSVFGEHAPVTLFRLGCVASAPGPGLHTPLFDVDDQALAIGAKLLARTTIAASMALSDNTA